MDKYIYDENNGLWYELQDDYYIPCLILPAEQEAIYIGVWGRRHLRYIRQHKKVFYTNLLTSGKLQSYLADIDRQAQKRLEVIIDQMKASEGVTEELKAADQIGWVGVVNNIRNRAEEIVLHELIYSEDIA